MKSKGSLRGGISVSGLPGVRSSLDKYVKWFGAKNVTPALMDGGRIIRDAAKANAPVRTGKLRDAIFAAPGKPDDEQPDVLVGVLAKKAPHAWWYEFGSAKVSPIAYMRRAIDSTGGAVLQAIATRLKRDLGLS